MVIHNSAAGLDPRYSTPWFKIYKATIQNLVGADYLGRFELLEFNRYFLTTGSLCLFSKVLVGCAALAGELKGLGSNAMFT